LTNESVPDRTEPSAWARAHKACFEIQPLIEVHDGKKVQVGFELSLYAQMDMKAPPGEAKQGHAETYRRLREMLESVVGPEHPVARLDIAPLRAAAKLRPETGFAPEIELSARVVRKHDTFEAVPAEARAGLGFLEDGLLALGIARGVAKGGSS
jgi:hypothetical protein